MDSPITLDLTQKAFSELETKLMAAGVRVPVDQDGFINLSGVRAQRLKLGGDDHKHTSKNRAVSTLDKGDTIGELCRAWGIDRPRHRLRPT